MIQLAAILMLKDEPEAIMTTLRPLILLDKPLAAIIVYYTDTNDNTTPLIKNFCADNKIRLFIKYKPKDEIEAERAKGYFNYGENRNKCLDFMRSVSNGDIADVDGEKGVHIDYTITLDASDQIITKNIHAILTQLSKNDLICVVRQVHEKNNGLQSFTAALVFKPSASIKYRWRIHETVCDMNGEDIDAACINRDIVVFQDRTGLETQNALARAPKDILACTDDMDEFPNDTRPYFIMGRIYQGKQMQNKAVEYYQKRVDMGNNNEQRRSEYYLSLLYIGAASSEKPEKMISYYMQAYEALHIASPLIAMCQYYLTKENWGMAYHMAKLATELPVPNASTVPVNDNEYNYIRWRYLALASLHYKHMFDAGAALAIMKNHPRADQNEIRLMQASYSKQAGPLFY